MKQYFAVGTYTEDILFGTGEVFHGKGKGIVLCEFEDGRIRVINELETRNPSFLCIREDKKKLYAVNEMKEYQGEFGGGVTQVSYEAGGKMRIEASYPTKGTDPCHIIVSPDNTFLSVANFASGSITVYPLDDEGNIAAEGRLYQHEGSSVHPVRQKGPHAHSSVFAPDRKRMYVPDLGTDKVVAYDYEGGVVVRAEQDCVNVQPGSGPRFGEFDKAGRHFYLIDEISSQVQHFRYEEGVMIPMETVETLPEDYAGDNICSDLHLTPDGKWLFASNRGHDSLVCYQIREDGSLDYHYRVGSGGRTPRNFAIDPLGRYLLAGNQDSDNITVFAIEEDGKLTQVSQIAMGSPVCIRFFEEPLC